MQRKELFAQLEECMLTIGKEMHEAKLSESGLSPALSHVMRVLGAYKTITVKELSQILHVTSGATTQHLDVLEKLGYIERTVNPGDRREACIDLTLSGKKKVGQICEFQYHLLSSLFEDIDDGELEMLVRVMQKVASKYTKERKNERE